MALTDVTGITKVSRSQGHRSMVLSSVKYQDLHPMFHTVDPITVWRSSLHAVVGSPPRYSAILQRERRRRGGGAGYHSFSHRLD